MCDYLNFKYYSFNHFSCVVEVAVISCKMPECIIIDSRDMFCCISGNADAVFSVVFLSVGFSFVFFIVIMGMGKYCLFPSWSLGIFLIPSKIIDNPSTSSAFLS